MTSSALALPPGSSCGVEFDVPTSDSRTQYKRRRISSHWDLGEVQASLPSLASPDYYTEPCLADLAAREILDPGYCGRVPDFIVGKFGYGCVKFLGITDVRKLELDHIVKFNRHEIVVYGDESNKPEVGQGLNKPAEVTLNLKIRPFDSDRERYNAIVKTLMLSLERQGGRFISFDSRNGNWSFLVQHFSRFGLSEDDEEDITMDDFEEVHDPSKINDAEILEENGTAREEIQPTGPMLYHSLPAHLGLDPIKMREMKMLMFPVEDEEDVEDFDDLSHPNLSRSKEHMRRTLLNSSQRMSHISNTPVVRKPPLALLDYNPAGINSDSPGNILMAQQNKGLPVKPIRGEGFKLNLERQTPVSGGHSRNIVDAGLFMGKSFRVGWGPNGVLLHSGAPVNSNSTERWSSSVINVEKVGIDKVVRDENDKTRKELVEFAFDAPLNLHKSLNHEIKQVQAGSYALKLQKVITNRLALAEICRSYIDIIEGQLEVPGLSSSSRLVLTHHVLIWELMKVLFSERENSGPLKSLGADNEEDMMPDVKEGSPEIDPEALSLVRRAEFSCWLQESVCHRVQEDVSALDESSYLEHIFLLLTGRQLDAAVELAVSRGDVRLACLLSHAGGSTVNRDDIAHQLDIWRTNGLDFNFVEKERTRLYELLSGNIHNALQGVKIDWKRFLGLLMWYHLPPDTPLPVIFQNYQLLLHEGKAPYPLPIYIDEGPVEEALGVTEKSFDLTYYLMLLHANGEGNFGYLKTMFSNFSSTYDPLDYHMIWHQRAVLEAVGVFTSNDLQVLDMGIVSQLLCTGQCHWAIYVVLHMPQCDDYPHFHATVIREILFQYCETWSSDESQHQFIQDLEIPSEWLHEAMAVYFNYYGNMSKALEHFLECAQWQKAHSIFTTSVSHTLFLSGDHSEVWRVATVMEEQKSQIENWELGAGIYISFFLLKSSFQEDNDTINEEDPLGSQISDCEEFLSQLNESLAVLGERLPTDARIAYSKMGEEISEMLLSISSRGESRDAQLRCFDTVLKAPVPEDVCSNHLQDAVSLFTCYLSEMAAQSA
ncbi:Nuclear pore complex protein NUP96 [Linum perenne]